VQALDHVAYHGYVGMRAESDSDCLEAARSQISLKLIEHLCEL
jgi:hypothetical protein